MYRTRAHCVSKQHSAERTGLMAVVFLNKNKNKNEKYLQNEN